MPLQGSVEQWVAALQPILAEGNDSQMFAFVMSLSSVLMRLTGERGGIFSMTGKSGQGKSTVQAAAASVFGHVESAFSKAQDTDNARVAFMSVMHNLPVHAEELTKLTADRLAVLAYDVSEGRDKRRLDRSGQMRESTAEWQLVLTSSSNAPVIDKLLNANATAEAFRVLEMHLTLPLNAKPHTGDVMKRELMHNAGAAGHVIAQYLVDHREALGAALDTAKVTIQNDLRAVTAERIRINMLGAGVVMAHVLRNALQVNVAPNTIMSIGKRLILSARAQQASFATSNAEVLTDFINENIPNCIQFSANNVLSMMVNTRAPYTMRYTAADQRLSIATRSLRHYVMERRVDWHDFERELRAARLFLCEVRTTLTKGCVGLPPQGQTSCMEFDTSQLGIDFSKEVEIQPVAA
jgi:hypothetical protein